MHFYDFSDIEITYKNASDKTIQVYSTTKTWDILPHQLVWLIRDQSGNWVRKNRSTEERLYEQCPIVICDNTILLEITHPCIQYSNITAVTLLCIYHCKTWLLYPKSTVSILGFADLRFSRVDTMPTSLKTSRDVFLKNQGPDRELHITNVGSKGILVGVGLRVWYLETNETLHLSRQSSKRSLVKDTPTTSPTQIYTYDSTVNYPLEVPVPLGCTLVHITVVGGGAAGESGTKSYSLPKGGGSGQYNQTTLSVIQNTVIKVTVGEGGLPNSRPNGNVSCVSYVNPDLGSSFCIVGTGGVYGNGNALGLLPGKGNGGGGGAPGPLLSYGTALLARGGDEDFVSNQGCNGDLGGGGGAGKVGGKGGNGYVILTYC